MKKRRPFSNPKQRRDKISVRGNLSATKGRGAVIPATDAIEPARAQEGQGTRAETVVIPYKVRNNDPSLQEFEIF